MALTNRGAFLITGTYFNSAALPTNVYAALATNQTPPTTSTNTWGELTEIDAGNGYTAGGIQLNLDNTDFPGLLEVDGSNWAEIFIRDLQWSAVGGSIPGTGNGARWLVLMDDNATPANRQVIGYWDLQSDRVVTVGNDLTIQQTELRARTV